jgi:protein-tyrosine kinase
MNAKTERIAAVRDQAEAREANPSGAQGDSGAERYEFSSDLMTLTNGRPAEAEAIRTIRTHIMAQHLGDGRRGLAVCAPTAGVGSSMTAANLAVALSQAGVATLLIDGDMRAPQLEAYIRPMGSTRGLKQCLREADIRPMDIIHHEVLPNLSLMYSGGVEDEAQELLATEAFRSLIETCLRDFEFTIIDTPPSKGVADALRIASIIGYALVVAKAHTSRSSDISTLVKQLQEDGAVVVGTVLNEL